MYTSADNDIDMQPSRVSGWVGFIWFAAVMMILAGIFDIIWGITALVRDEVFIVGTRGVVLNIDITAWGWIKLILGVVMVIAGFLLFAGKVWACILAVGVAMLSAVANLLAIGAYPVWSVIVIALDVMVIYAITVHGHELRENQ